MRPGPAPTTDYAALVQGDRIHASLYTDPRIFAEEIERIFHRGWVFVGHASEIPRPGDFVTRTLGGEPVIMVRGPEGDVSVLVNRCMHRGTMLCPADRGHTRTFSCPYHGWTYDLGGELLRGVARPVDGGRRVLGARHHGPLRQSRPEPLAHLRQPRLETRIKLLETGDRYSQEPASLMRRLISNVEVERAENGELVAGSNFILGELAVQARRELHWWVGRTTHRLRPLDGALKMSRKTVVLINAAEPLPNLSFLI